MVDMHDPAIPAGQVGSVSDIVFGGESMWLLAEEEPPPQWWRHWWRLQLDCSLVQPRTADVWR